MSAAVFIELNFQASDGWPIDWQPATLFSTLSGNVNTCPRLSMPEDHELLFFLDVYFSIFYFILFLLYFFPLLIITSNKTHVTAQCDEAVWQAIPSCLIIKERFYFVFPSCKLL